METRSDLAAKISVLDQAYQKLTGNSFGPQRGVINWREDPWMRWMAEGWDVHDLETVVLWLKPKIKRGERRPECLGFRRLICQIDVFCDELSQANAEKRNLPVPKTAREQALGCLRPEVDAHNRPNNQTPLRVKQPRDTIPKLIAALREAAK